MISQCAVTSEPLDLEHLTERMNSIDCSIDSNVEQNLDGILTSLIPIMKHQMWINVRNKRSNYDVKGKISLLFDRAAMIKMHNYLFPVVTNWLPLPLHWHSQDELWWSKTFWFSSRVMMKCRTNKKRRCVKNPRTPICVIHRINWTIKLFYGLPGILTQLSTIINNNLKIGLVT